MPSERAGRAFRDMQLACRLIIDWVADAGSVEAAVYRDPKTRSAIERQLLIISEAAIRLSKHDPTLCDELAPHIDWAGVRGIGNVLRHGYDELDARVITGVLAGKLQDLQAAVDAALTTLQTQRGR